jgi:hypothetical protein
VRHRAHGDRGQGPALGQATIKDGYADIKDGELWLHNVHIPPYVDAARENHEPERTRKLLAKRYEIERYMGRVKEKGLTLVPTRIYFKGQRAKVEIALARARTASTSARRSSAATPSARCSASSETQCADIRAQRPAARLRYPPWCVPSVLTSVPLAGRLRPSARRALAGGFVLLAAAWALHAVLVLAGAPSAGGAPHRLSDLLYVLTGLTAAVLVVARARLVPDERAAWWCWPPAPPRGRWATSRGTCSTATRPTRRSRPSRTSSGSARTCRRTRASASSSPRGSGGSRGPWGSMAWWASSGPPRVALVLAGDDLTGWPTRPGSWRR